MLLHGANDARPLREDRQPSPLLLVFLRQPPLGRRSAPSPIATAAILLRVTLAPRSKTDPTRHADCTTVAETTRASFRVRIAFGNGGAVGHGCGGGPADRVVARLTLGAEEFRCALN